MRAVRVKSLVYTRRVSTNIEEMIADEGFGFHAKSQFFGLQEKYKGNKWKQLSAKPLSAYDEVDSSLFVYNSWWG